MSKTVMFIHGAWLTPASFDNFRSLYEERGYKCFAPPWPYEDRPRADLIASPAPELRKLSIRKIVDHYDRIIRALPEAPILIGHSFGGLFVQLLMDRGLGASGVAINPGAPRGVLPGLRTLRSALPVLLTWNGWNKVLTMSRTQFERDFAQNLTPRQLAAAYDRHVIPTPGRIYFQGALGIQTGLNYANPQRAPLLMMTCGDDRIVQPSMVRAAFKKQRQAPAVTEFISIPDRCHFVMEEAGWEDVADQALDFASTYARVRPTPELREPHFRPLPRQHSRSLA